MKLAKINNILENTKRYINSPDLYSFGDIALDLYDLHRFHNKNYKKYSIGKLNDWRKIPLVPSYEFTKRKLQLNNFSGASLSNEVEFISKSSKPKHHVLKDTEFLRSSIINNFSFNVLNTNSFPTNRVVFLDDQKSHSMLSYIYEYLSQTYDFRGIYDYVNPTDADAVKNFVEFISSPQFEPLIVVGTPNIFYKFKLTLDSLDLNSIVDTSPGTPIVIEFGDYIEESKMDLTLYELNNWLKDFFHTSINNVVQIYYNTELSSQLFRWGDHMPYFIPHTVAVRSIDPSTGEELEPGVEGNLAFVDIANVWSCPFIISDDLGITYSNNKAVQITRRSNEVIKTGVNPK